MLPKFLARIAGRRKPDFVIGDDYLRRWWVIPRNRFFNVYLHNIRAPDDDRALHDHPWFNLSIILNGGYMEVTGEGYTRREAGEWVWRSPWASHRLIPLDVAQYGECWTLFLTGPRVRTWGFHCAKGWRPWFEFTAPADKGQVGRGCD